MKYKIILILSLCFAVHASEKWKNPSTRYMNVYKKYINSKCPILKNHIKHFVYFSKDRQKIKNHPFLRHNRFYGAQIMYSWRDLEKQRGRYDFSIIQEDYEYLKLYGKKLFVQLQDATFYPQNKAVPNYIESKEFDGGVVCQREEKSSQCEGWVSKRWNKNIQRRFNLLIKALGEKFDGKIEGINLQETAIGVSKKTDISFSPSIYVNSIKANMLSLKKAFSKSVTMQYANFMPGEWLPWDDKGYLKSIYKYGEKIGVGLGTPDLMIRRKGQLNHALAMMHENKYTVPLGIAIQDGNYIGLTGADGELVSKQKHIKHNNIVPILESFANNFLHVDYMFWVNQVPYFKNDVMPCFR